MENVVLSAQHYLGCENCEENPAIFMCKTCPGHLCENCKTEHEMKKMTKSHDIISLKSNNEDLVDLLCCSDHAKKKLECYCNICREPVCTDCIIQSHNGHSVKSLTTVYKEFTSCSYRKKEEIAKVILPKYKELLAKEIEKRSLFIKKVDEIEKKIDSHTQKVVEMAQETGKRTVETLKKAEKEGLQESDKFKDNIEEQINLLQQMCERISASLEAKPELEFFKSFEKGGLEKFHKLPTQPDYSLTDFNPGNISQDLQRTFGVPPMLQRSRHVLREYSSVSIK